MAPVIHRQEKPRLLTGAELGRGSVYMIEHMPYAEQRELTFSVSQF